MADARVHLITHWLEDMAYKTHPHHRRYHSWFSPLERNIIVVLLKYNNVVVVSPESTGCLVHLQFIIDILEHLICSWSPYLTLLDASSIGRSQLTNSCPRTGDLS